LKTVGGVLETFSALLKVKNNDTVGNAWKKRKPIRAILTMSSDILLAARKAASQ
jgi:hypothetical protein